MKPTHTSNLKVSRDGSFSIIAEQHEDCAVVRLRGSCTMEVAAELGEELLSLASKPVRLLVVEMSALDFIESTGLGGIIAGHLRVRRNHGELRLVAPRPAIAQLLELTRLTQLFRIFDSVEAALAAPLTQEG